MQWHKRLERNVSQIMFFIPNPACPLPTPVHKVIPDASIYGICTILGNTKVETLLNKTSHGIKRLSVILTMLPENALKISYNFNEKGLRQGQK